MRKVRKSQSQKERQWLLMMANVGTKELMAKLELVERAGSQKWR